MTEWEPHVSQELGNDNWIQKCNSNGRSGSSWYLQFQQKERLLRGLGMWCNCLVTKPCSTLCDPVDCSTPGSSVHGISQARILQWFAISFSRGSSQPRDGTCVSYIAGTFLRCRRILYHWITRKALYYLINGNNLIWTFPQMLIFWLQREGTRVFLFPGEKPLSFCLSDMAK